MSDSKSPWAKPQAAPPTPATLAPPPRHPHLNYDGAAIAPADDDDWLEGFVPDFAEAIEHRIRTGKPGSPEVMKAMDMLMRHEAAEMNRDLPIFTGATFAQVQNPEFWRQLQPFQEATVDVMGMWFLSFSHVGDSTANDTMLVTSRFPEDLEAEEITASGQTPEGLAADLTSELQRWCRINKKPFTV